MNFVFQLPIYHEHRGSESIFIVGDHFPKIAHSISCKKTLNAILIVQLFLLRSCSCMDCWRLSDCNSKFPNHFWCNIWKRLDTFLQYRSTIYPRKDGILRNILRNLTQENPKQYHNVLPQAEFAHNNMQNKSSNKSSLEIVYIWPPSHKLVWSHYPSFNVWIELLTTWLKKWRLFAVKSKDN